MLGRSMSVQLYACASCCFLFCHRRISNKSRTHLKRSWCPCENMILWYCWQNQMQDSQPGMFTVCIMYVFPRGPLHTPPLSQHPITQYRSWFTYPWLFASFRDVWVFLVLLFPMVVYVWVIGLVLNRQCASGHPCPQTAFWWSIA